MNITKDNLPDALNMFEGVTMNQSYIDSFRLADEVAEDLNHSYIGTEHMLWGIAAEGSNPTLAQLGVKARDIKEGIEFIVGVGDRVHNPKSLITRSLRAMERSADRGLSLGIRTLDSGLLLMGLVRDGDCLGVSLLERLGVRTSEIGELEIQRRGIVELHPTRTP